MMVTLEAQRYFVSLLAKQNLGTEIRAFVNDAGSPSAKCGVCFCTVESFQISDVLINFEFISIRVEKGIIDFLKDSVIDVLKCGLDVQVTFKVPYAKGICNVGVSDDKKNSDNILSLKKKIAKVLDVHINPQLFLHGGNVSLIDITDELLVILKFSGGCNGCSMASYTMQSGIKNTLKKIFPQLKGVYDVTEHYRGMHSYY